MPDSLKESPPHSPFLPSPGSKRKELSSSAEVGQLVAESSSKKARRETSQSPVPCGSVSPEESDHEDIGTGKKAEPVTAEAQLEDAEAELSASVLLLNEYRT